MISTCSTCTRTNTTHTNTHKQTGPSTDRVPWQSALAECPDRVPPAYIRSYFCMRWSTISSLLSHYLSLRNACMQTSSTLIPSVFLFPCFIFFKEVRDHVNSNSGDGIMNRGGEGEESTEGKLCCCPSFPPRERELWHNHWLTACCFSLSFSLCGLDHVAPQQYPMPVNRPVSIYRISANQVYVMSVNIGLVLEKQHKWVVVLVPKLCVKVLDITAL